MAERKIKFIYNGQELIIQCKKEESTKDILQRYLNKIQKTHEDVYFLHNGAIFDSNHKFDENDSDEKTVLVCNHGANKGDKSQEKKISYSKDIICPTCGESSLITFSDYKINISSCDNGHNKKNISLENFKETQKINEDEIKCNKCQTKRIETFDQKFYYCYDCKMNLCPLCENSNHNKNHKIFEYATKKYYCKKHGEKMISYCKQCKKNLCDICGLEHDKKHYLIYHREIFENSKITNLNELRSKIDELKTEINNIINEFNKVLNNLEIYYEINNNMAKNFNINNKNYQTLSNMKYLNDYNKEIIKNINDIMEQIKKENKFSLLNQIYIKMFSFIEIILKYKKEKYDDKTIQIFGKEFVKNNKNNFKMMINNKIYELNYELEKEQINSEIIEVKLIQYKKTNNLSYMFGEDHSNTPLISISDNFENFDMSNIINISNMFSCCKYLKSLPDISKWNLNNVIDISHLFYFCESLKSLPDISKWNTDNVNDISHIFCGCKSLLSLPDISKWNTKNVHNMSSIFCFCESLKSLPDISKWNTNNVNGMSDIFSHCKSLKSLPDISQWNTYNVKEMRCMFEWCETLKSLPDISKWNTYNMKYINGIFSYCKSLLSLPDISKWNTNEVTEMRSVFSGCESLISLPDISKWNTKNVYGMSDIFSHCKSLKSLPDISKWDFSNIEIIKDIVSHCSNNLNLSVIPDVKLHLFKGYMYENQFTKFLDILKNLLNKKEKIENKFEIKTSIKDLDGINLRVASLKNIDFEKTFEISPKEKNFKWISTLKFEIKNENKDFYAEWQKWKALIDGYIYKYNDKYELELRQNGKNLYFDFISKNNDAFKRILDCLLDIVEFDITLKSGIDAILLLN